MVKTFNNALGLDIGERRTGVARVNSTARIPEPLGTIPTLLLQEKLPVLVREHAIDLIVVGLPRNMKGQETKQTQYVRDIVSESVWPFAGDKKIEVVFSDETLSTVYAKERTSADDLKRLGVDSFAAAEILSSYLLSGDMA